MTRLSGRPDAGPEVGKVIAMDRFRSGKSLSPIRQAEAYWCALRDGGDIPKRSQIDPRGLENILEYAFILERVAPGIARFRLAGHHLNDLAGMEVRGMPLTAFFTPAGRREIGAVLESVFDTPAVAELSLIGERQRGGASQEARMILMPLKSDLGDTNRALGVLVADGPTLRTPRRFDVENAAMRPVSGMQVQAAVDAAEPAREPVSGFEEAQSPLQGRAPHLRLVK